MGIVLDIQMKLRPTGCATYQAAKDEIVRQAGEGW